MKNQKIVFVLFSSLFKKGGHSKNFLNIVKHMSKDIEENTIDAIIISLNNSKKEMQKSKIEISANDYFKAYTIDQFLRFFPSGNTIYQLLEFVLNLVRILSVLIKHKPKVVYCYAGMPLFLLFIWKTIFRFKLIYDVRGNMLDEARIRGTNRLKLALLGKIHKYAMSKTNLIFSVSSTFPAQKKTCIYPKFNYYDGDIFYYHEKQAKLNRRNLKLENILEGHIHWNYDFSDSL